MSLGVTARSLLAGKALALAWSIAILLLPAAVIGGRAALIQSAPYRLPDTPARLVSPGLGCAVHDGISIFVALALSARMRTPRMQLTALLGFWLSTAVLLPSAIPHRS